MSDPVLPRPLRGIIPPLATPLLSREELDRAGLERLIEHVLAGGVHGLFLLGTTGEGASLGHGIRHELIERACKQVAGRVPVLVGITDPSFMESVRLAEHAQDAGADAVVLAPPFYFPISQADLRMYLRAMAAEVPLPIFLYNIPSHTRVGFDLETLRIALDLPNVIGLKDSAGDMKAFACAREVTARRADWTLLIGPEEHLAEATLLGCHGGVCGGANLDPRLYVELFEAATRRDLAQVHRLQQRVEYIVRNIYGLGVTHGYWLKGLKCALSCLGICENVLAEPLHGLGEPERQVIQRHLEELGLIAVVRSPI
jgi:4-hydroxy-tetrahydrodipicolinate synthase